MNNVQKGCWVVPFLRNPRFVGRQHQLKDLGKTVFGKNQSRKAAITRLEGVGKALDHANIASYTVTPRGNVESLGNMVPVTFSKVTGSCRSMMWVRG
jgi:hypothetical protein